MPSSFLLNEFYGYYVLSNGPNWEDICIIPIFGVIFEKKWVFDPPGYPLQGYPTLFTINFE
jgi:hypothetical protein